MWRDSINRKYRAEWRPLIGCVVILTRVPGAAPGAWGTLRAVYAQGLIVDTANYGIWISFIDLYCGHAIMQLPQVQSA